jgi:hypothetical protein
MELLAQNGKMKKSQKSKHRIYNWGIPAFKNSKGETTCPNAKKCVAGCYARNGAYIWKPAVAAYERRFAVSKLPGFADLMVLAIQHKDELASKKRQNLIIRIHDSGDFYSKDYFTNWMNIADRCPDVLFYGYTKMVSLVKNYEEWIPPNMKLCFSFGGREDKLIDVENDVHSKVFKDAVPPDYADASHDDMVLALGNNNKIGLIYHGPNKGNFGH